MFLCLHAVAVFSIGRSTYAVSESAEVVIVEVSLLHGVLDRTVTLQLDSQDISATGTFMHNIITISH